MSINPNETRTGAVPDKMTGYTDEERALARSVQGGHEARNRKLGHLGYMGLGLAGIAAVVGGYFATAGGEKATEPKQEPAASAPANPSEKSSNEIEASLADLNVVASDEQIEYVINNPVQAGDYDSPEEYLNAISLRNNVIFNIDRLDFKAEKNEYGYQPLLPEAQEKFDAMFNTLYDQNSEGYPTLYKSMLRTTQNNANVVGMGYQVTNFITPVEGSGSVEGDKMTVTGVLDTVSDNEEWDEGDGMTVRFTLQTGEDGVVRIAHTKELE